MKKVLIILFTFIWMMSQVCAQQDKKTISISLTDTPIYELMSIIGDTFEVGVSLSKEVKGNVSLSITNASLEQTMDALTKANNCKWLQWNNVIYIISNKEFADNRLDEIKDTMDIYYSKPLITHERINLKRYSQDPIMVRSMNPTFDEFPDSSLIDFSYLLDAPAGKHGQVVIRNGHFYFQNDTKRIRFWGVTVAASNVDIPKERIAQVVDVLAHAGCNVLRLHELDNRGGEQYNLVRRDIIDEAYPNDKDSQHFDKEYLDRVDYWIKCAQDKGIYTYLVVRGYRTFREGDDVPNADKLGRAAKPYAMFDRRLIDLQKDYADQWLIQHVNPYTGKPNGKNPAVAMIEIENEDSLFFHAQEWNSMLEPYRAEFLGLWNDYLVKKYKTTEELKKAWTNEKGECALGSEESLEKKNISLPTMPERSLEEIRTASGADSKTAPLKCNEGARFAVEVQRKYFAEIRDFLHEKGCTLPMTAVVDMEVTPDTYSVAQELDFIGENAYQDHPSFQAGKEWVGLPFYSNKNYIKESGKWSLAPYMAQYKWAGKPLVVREWATCWPNRYRVTSALDIAAYALLQDYDGLIHFSYYTWGNDNVNDAFGLQADPTRWGLFGYAAKLFIEGNIDNINTIPIEYPEKDLFTWGNYMSDIYSIAWTIRIENTDKFTPYYGEGFIIDNGIYSNRRSLQGTDYAYKRYFPTSDSLKILKAGSVLYRDTEKGYATINTPTFQCVQGQLEKYQPYEASNLKVISASTIGCVVITALDGKPLTQSTHYSLKMATVSINRGERLDAVTTGHGAGQFVLMSSGGAPIQTLGKPVEKPTQISLNGKPLIDAYLENGTWELELDTQNKICRLFCDTPNTQFTISGNNGFMMQKYYYEYPPDEPVKVENTFIYPGFAKYIALTGDVSFR